MFRALPAIAKMVSNPRRSLVDAAMRKQHFPLRALGRSLVAVLPLFGAVSRSDATIVAPFSPQQAAARSGFVFAGTVTAARSERLPGTIVTRVVFSDLQFAKGSTQSDSLVLTLEGGTVGNDLIVVDGQPTFEQGERYIVFAIADCGSSSNSYMPVIGLHQGYFRVAPSPARGKGVVRDFQGLDVVSLAPERVTVVIPDSLIPESSRTVIETSPHREVEGEPSEPGRTRKVLLEHDDPKTRLTEDEFLEAVRRFTR